MEVGWYGLGVFPVGGAILCTAGVIRPPGVRAPKGVIPPGIGLTPAAIPPMCLSIFVIHLI
jgi:hypothetical protein